MPLHPNDLTIYCITARGRHGVIDIGDGDGLLVLGKNAAEREAESVMCWPAVTSVTSEAYAWNGPDERAILLDAYFNGVDLGGPVAALAAEHGITLTSDPFSAVEMVLAELRARTQEATAWAS